MIPLIDRAAAHGSRTAIVSNEQSFSYAQLLEDAAVVSQYLLNGRADLNEARIAFITPPTYEYVKVQWGIWRAGGIAVPLCVKHPFASLEYVIGDTSAEVLIYTDEFEELITPFKKRSDLKVVNLKNVDGQTTSLPDVNLQRRAMIVYTSGTTGKPKGVVTTHANIDAQITALIDAWGWQSDDHILNVLPLHHVHGIVNVVACALYAGARCEMLPKFDAKIVFEKFAEGQVNVFMAVPTIYYQLMAIWEDFTPETQADLTTKMKAFRLMISGSAALPLTTMDRWKKISDQTLLERYGMTEMGMAITNPYDGERRRGYIGQPLAHMQARLVDEQGQPVSPGTSGEIQVKGPNVFKEYWGKPQATAEAFTADGWFKTGDIAVIEDGYYRILGRNSVDIIKSGGYKISALEIEDVLRTHDQIKDCAVVGIPDEEWGETIACCLVTTNQQLDFEALNTWLKDRIPAYKIPRQYEIQTDLPRNVMGKVTKQAVKKLFA